MDANTEPAISNKMLKSACSIGSLLSTATTQGGTLSDPPVKDKHQDQKPLEVHSKCWRELEVKNMLLSGDAKSISRLREFRLYNDAYAQMEGLQPLSSQKERLVFPESWDWRLSQSLLEGPEATAAKLAKQSIRRFSQIPFEELVRRAYGHPSQGIDDLHREYEFLKVQVYSTFTRNLEHLEFLNQLKGCLNEIDADPFVCTAIERAWQGVVSQRKPHVPFVEEKSENMNPELDERLQWIIDPLQRLLQSSDTAQNVLRQLKILKIRFSKLYRSPEGSPEASWGVFSTDTHFFELIQWTDVSGLAMALSRKDQDVFSHCLVNVFYAKDDHARRALNTRWNRLSIAVEECMVAEVDMSRKLDHLTQELYRVSNYYSLTAIIQGIKASGFPTKALRNFGHLINSEHNYQRYQQLMKHMSTRPGIHFLVPALSTAVRGNLNLADMALRLNMNTWHPPSTSTLFTPYHPHSATSTSEDAAPQFRLSFFKLPIYPYPQPSVKLTEPLLKSQQGPDLVDILDGQSQQQTWTVPTFSRVKLLVLSTFEPV
ncbi:hypothetical protein PENANT_c108G02718 [Penicillium antarcticum]|uniref:Ras-GEF domain-containing protein n=1 Tax=Penicillium antarcticum TaxID=416450 RepID=A0A1V6PK61_9EURO|nr:hypothetical protein PENANT_c108G02718 [Penicillium antarcticum]